MLVHYLDDFFLCSYPSQYCKEDMEVIESVFSELGVPLAPDSYWTSTTITYLGIEIDSAAQTIKLPQEKFKDLRSLLLSWNAKKKFIKHDLLSLIGSLAFACKVVKPGRIFLRRLIDLSTSVNSLNHHIYLNSEARADIVWWIDFLPSWNGIEYIQQPLVTSISLSWYADASMLGCDAVYDNQWFLTCWPTHFKDYHINFLELFAVVSAVFMWGSAWKHKQILFYTDNLPVTKIWLYGTYKVFSV